jgi:hypothetical protein
MSDFKETLILITKDNLTLIQKVTLIELLLTNIEVDTVSEIARIETKKGNTITRNGVLSSPRFRKFKIGKQMFAIKGLHNHNLPF